VTLTSAAMAEIASARRVTIESNIVVVSDLVVTSTMSAARDLLRQARFRQAQTDERITHPLCVYNGLGAPTCRACPGVKLDTKSWSIHIESASHKRNAANYNDARAQSLSQRSSTVPAALNEPVTDAVVDQSNSNNNNNNNNNNSIEIDSKSPPVVVVVESVSTAPQLPPGFFDDDIAAHDNKAALLDAEFAEFEEAVRDKLEATDDADVAADAAVAVANELEQSQAKIQQAGSTQIALQACAPRWRRIDGAPKKKVAKQSNGDDNDDECEELSDLDDDAWRRRATKK
jgi:hypothetical protein